MIKEDNNKSSLFFNSLKVMYISHFIGGIFLLITAIILKINNSENNYTWISTVIFICSSLSLLFSVILFLFYNTKHKRNR